MRLLSWPSPSKCDFSSPDPHLLYATSFRTLTFPMRLLSGPSLSSCDFSQDPHFPHAPSLRTLTIPMRLLSGPSPSLPTHLGVIKCWNALLVLYFCRSRGNYSPPVSTKRQHIIWLDGLHERLSSSELGALVTTLEQRIMLQPLMLSSLQTWTRIFPLNSAEVKRCYCY